MVNISLKADINVDGSVFITRPPEDHPDKSFVYKPDFHLLQYFDDADRIVTLDKCDYSIGKGYVLHSCGTRPYISHKPKGKTRAINIIFRIEESQLAYKDQTISIPFIVDMNQHPTIRLMFEELVYLSLKPGSLEKMKTDLLLKRILVEIVAFEKNSRYVSSASFQHSIACIEKQVGKNFTIEELASISGMSRSTYIRTFKRITGKSVKSYILETKLRIAITILTTEAGVSVKEVAYQLGFCDEFHFSKIFKKHTGKSPSAYQII